MDAASGSTNYLPDMSKIAHPYTIWHLSMVTAVPDHVADILHVLPRRLRRPLQYAFANHVTKERPLSILHERKSYVLIRKKAFVS
jgi:hypothetical protein